MSNPKAEAWNHIGGMFWTHGRESARPSVEELESFCEDVCPGDPVCLIGASTRELAEALLDKGARLKVLDFSERMCRDLALAVPGADIEVCDITQSIEDSLSGKYTLVVSDRLINRFDLAEAYRGARGMYDLLAPGGHVKTSVFLGLYPMDKTMIAYAKQHGGDERFWDFSSQTIDFAAAEDALESGILPHGTIPKELLKLWYVGRGREKRFTADEVHEILMSAGFGEVTVSPFPDAAGTELFVAARTD